MQPFIVVCMIDPIHNIGNICNLLSHGSRDQRAGAFTIDAVIIMYINNNGGGRDVQTFLEPKEWALVRHGYPLYISQ